MGGAQGLSRENKSGLLEHRSSSANQRGAFEGLAGASTWQVDLSTKENRIVPDTLADVLITYTMSGYYDADFDRAVTSAVNASKPFAISASVSARRVLPDAFYSLTQYGKLDWNVTPDILGLAGGSGRLRNVAVFLRLTASTLEVGRCYCHYSMQIQIDNAGNVVVSTALPHFTLSPDAANTMLLKVAYQQQSGENVDASWDFGDGSPIAAGLAASHAFARPGRYQVVVRLVKAGRLSEYRCAVNLSASHPMSVPLIVAPSFEYANTNLKVSAVGPFSFECAIGKNRAFSDSTGVANFSGIAKGGNYTIEFLALRPLFARVYSRQNFIADSTRGVTLTRLHASTNRTFDVNGAETTTTPDDFTKLIFAGKTLSPDDRWTLELPLTQNPFLAGVSSSDVTQFDGSEFGDAVIRFEYDVTS